MVVLMVPPHPIQRAGWRREVSPRYPRAIVRLPVVVLAASLAASLAACGSTFQRPVDTVKGWVGANEGHQAPPSEARACPPPASEGVPVPPPMAEPPDIEGEGGDEGAARADGPIPAPVGPPGTVVWPPRGTAAGQAGNAPGRAPLAAPPGALPADVTDVATPRAWRTIVLHHSASKVGGASRFDQWHRAKGLDGVGYHFVIGNGTDTPDGAIETTSRWTEQVDGVHAKGWDDLSIGICLVGNFEDVDPTPAQMDALRQLVRHLRGRFSIPRERVVGHSQVNATACPGRHFSTKAVAAATDPSPSAGRAP